MGKTKEQELQVFEFNLDGLGTYWIAAKNLPEARKCYRDGIGLSEEEMWQDLSDSVVVIVPKEELKRLKYFDNNTSFAQVLNIHIRDHGNTPLLLACSE